MGEAADKPVGKPGSKPASLVGQTASSVIPDESTGCISAGQGRLEEEHATIYQSEK